MMQPVSRNTNPLPHPSGAFASAPPSGAQAPLTHAGGAKSPDVPVLFDTWSESYHPPLISPLSSSPDGKSAIGQTLYGRFFAFDPQTGREQWPTPQDLGPLAGAPVYTADGTAVIVLTRDGTLLSLDPSTGEKQWERSFSTKFSSGVVVGRDGWLYLSGRDNCLYRCDPADGEPAYTYDRGSSARGVPRVARDGTAFLLDWDNHVRAIGPDGAELWKRETGHVHSLSLGGDDTLYLAFDSGQISVRDPKSGDQRKGTSPYVGIYPSGWRPWVEVVEPSAPDLRDAGVLFRALPHTRVVAASDGGVVYAFDVEREEVVWAAHPRRLSPFTPQVLPDGTIVVPADDSRVYGLDPEDGEVMWTWAVPTKGPPRPYVNPQGELLCIDADGAVHAAQPPLRLSTGTGVGGKPIATAEGDANGGNRSREVGLEVGEDWILAGGVRIPRRRAEDRFSAGAT